jgi:hypothetical protein
VPVYGCGFLHEGESVQKPSIDKLGDHKAKWVKEYDPGSLLPRCRVPIFFVNGTNDVHYVLDSYMKSYNVVPGEKHLRIQIKMPHGHPPGWAPQEIGLFIDSKCRGGKPLPVPAKPMIKGDQVEVTLRIRNRLEESRTQLHHRHRSALKARLEVHPGHHHRPRHHRSQTAHRREHLVHHGHRRTRCDGEHSGGADTVKLSEKSGKLSPWRENLVAAPHVACILNR